MTVARTIYKNNIVAGAGEVRLARVLSDGTYDGERYVGDAVSLGLSVTANIVDVQSGSGATPIDLETIVTETDRTLNLVLHDVSAENLALFLQGETGSQTDAADTDGFEIKNVKVGRWYQLGQNAATPLGVGKISAVSTISKDGSNASAKKTNDAAITRSTDVTEYADDGILIDLKRGSVYINKTAGFNAGDTLYFTYTAAADAAARKTFKAGTKSVLGAIRYTEQSQDGATGHDIYARRCRISANGEMALMGRQNEQRISLTCKVLRATDGYPDLAGIESAGPSD